MKTQSEINHEVAQDKVQLAKDNETKPTASPSASEKGGAIVNTNIADTLETSARAVVAGIDRVKVYQWFALALSGHSSPTMVSVEVETKSYCLSKPKLSSFVNKDEWREAVKKHRIEAQSVAAALIKTASDKLIAAGFTVKLWLDYGWPKLNIIKREETYSQPMTASDHNAFPKGRW